MPDENEKIHPPPKPTPPREAPWTQLEEISSKLDKIVSALTGLPGVPPADVSAILTKLDKLIELLSVPMPPITELLPITSRLDLIVNRLKYGYITSIKPGMPWVMVGTTSAVVLDEDANRKFALLINDSDTTIYLALGKHAKLNAGIRLAPHGGYYEVNLDQAYIGKIYGICSAANKRLLVTEAT